MSTFPEYLHSLDDDQLRALIRSRPDAFFPTPPSSGSLATRLSLPGSASRALRQLSAADLAVLEKLADAGAELDPVDASGFGDAAHLRATWHPSTAPESLTLDPAMRWVGLTIERARGGADDDTGVVEFRARWRAGGAGGAAVALCATAAR